MRKILGVGVVAFALAGAGAAVANMFGSNSLKATSATFTATTASVLRTATCTASDGTYTDTRATYTGTATSTDTNLNGPITLNTDSLINGTTNLGTVTATLTIGSSPNGTNVQFSGVYSGGTVVGFAQGRRQGSDSQLLANLSAAFSATGGFTSGMIGGGTAAGEAVEVSQGGCQPASVTPERVDADGTASAISPTPFTSTSSITVAGVTCVIPTTLDSDVTGLDLTTGSQVEMSCTVSGGTNTLAQISTGGSHGHDFLPPIPLHGQFSIPFSHHGR